MEPRAGQFAGEWTEAYTVPVFKGAHADPVLLLVVPSAEADEIVEV
jgi:hypothetical protein